MSLKAKLEAVIYAAEEPVTLAQLAALFAADALEWKAQQEAAARSQSNGGLTDAESSDPDAAGRLDPADEPELESRSASEIAPPSTDVDGPLEIPIEIPVLDAAKEGYQIPLPEPAQLSEADPVLTEADQQTQAKLESRARAQEIKAVLRHLLNELINEFTCDDRGVEIREIAGGYRVATKPEYHDAVRSFVKSLKPALKLSLPALETLAVIAYKQPVTAPEVNEIRGVDSSGVFGSLLARKLIATAGRKQVIGRPILYKTTKEFLLRFGLKDISELPSMEEFEKMAAVELEEPEAADGEPTLPEDSREAIAADLNAELNEPDSADPDPAPESGAVTESGSGEKTSTPSESQ
jgi:segregation and condensation protein B